MKLYTAKKNKNSANICDDYFENAIKEIDFNNEKAHCYVKYNLDLEKSIPNENYYVFKNLNFKIGLKKLMKNNLKNSLISLTIMIVLGLISPSFGGIIVIIGIYFVFTLVTLIILVYKYPKELIIKNISIEEKNFINNQINLTYPIKVVEKEGSRNT